ncbi:MAG TPA: PAS domain S-box protein, partial [Candidatus Methanoperedenaceae archaeon]|nr:PAS domain S-box protein [Candidatus Methanoperedenaceae archaeon]
MVGLYADSNKENRRRIRASLENALAVANTEKNRAEAVIATVGDGLIIQDTDYKVLYQNEFSLDLSGNHVGEYCYKAFEGKDRICEWCPVELSFKDGKVHKTIRTVKNGNLTGHFELTSSPLRDPSGKIIAGVKLVRNITEQQSAKEELQAREHFLDDIFKSIKDGIGIIDRDMNIIRVNPAAEQWYAHNMPLVGKKCYEAYHNRSARCEVCPTQRTFETGEPAYEIVAKHGPGGMDIGWHEIHSFPMTDTATGQMTGAIEYVRDITYRKNIEMEKDRLLKAIACSNEGIAIADEKGRYIYMNEAHASIYGYTKDELIGKTWRDITPPDLIAGIEPGMPETLHNKNVGAFGGELPGMRRDGTTIPTEVKATGLWDEQGKYRGHICIVSDITKRKQAEGSLRLFSKAVEEAPDGVQIVDMDGKIIYSNMAVEEIYGFTREEFKGKHVNEMNEDPGLASKVIIPAIRENGRWIGEVMVKHKNGGVFHIWLNASMVKDSSGKPIAMVGIIRDLTERKKLDEIRIENERLISSNRAKTEFLNIMSHELRTPLTSIIGYSILLKEKAQGPLNDQQEHFVDNMLSNSNHLLELINTFLELAKIESGKLELSLENVSLPDVITETAYLMKENAAKRNVVLKDHFDPGLSTIKADGQKLKQILFNLMGNAIKFSKDEGGTVTVSTRKKDDFAEISVADTGIGIRKEDLPKLFRKFEQMDSGITRKYEGTGLGLAITKQL